MILYDNFTTLLRKKISILDRIGRSFNEAINRFN